MDERGTRQQHVNGFAHAGTETESENLDVSRAGSLRVIQQIIIKMNISKYIVRILCVATWLLLPVSVQVYGPHQAPIGVQGHDPQRVRVQGHDPQHVQVRGRQGEVQLPRSGAVISNVRLRGVMAKYMFPERINPIEMQQAQLTEVIVPRLRRPARMKVVPPLQPRGPMVHEARSRWEVLSPRRQEEHGVHGQGELIDDCCKVLNSSPLSVIVPQSILGQS